MATSNVCAELMLPTGYVRAIIASCSISRVTLSLSAESEIAKTCMTKTLEREISRTVRQKRQQLSTIREEVENLLDYLDVLEARSKDAGKPRLSHAEVKKRFG
jgi:tRNA U34 5-carboxymethylaminomethyl modifying GTPase MnmE/TrmE